MMAGLFIIYSIAIGLIIGGQRRLAMTFIIIGLILCMAMFKYHATDVIDIRI